jgi:hypothetical protein
MIFSRTKARNDRIQVVESAVRPSLRNWATVEACKEGKFRLVGRG